MTGGYLTLDFSDVEFKEQDSSKIVDFTLGYKKGIGNYISKTKKPIYLLLSDSVCNAICAYYSINIEVKNKSPFYLIPALTDTEYGKTDRAFLLKSNYSETYSIDSLTLYGLMVSFDGDRVYFRES